jgi:hypothetical protein
MHARLYKRPLCLFKGFDWLSFGWAVCPGPLACKGVYAAESILYLCGAQLSQQNFCLARPLLPESVARDGENAWRDANAKVKFFPALLVCAPKCARSPQGPSSFLQLP